MQGAWVRSLVRELRSQMPRCGVAKKKNRKKETRKEKKKKRDNGDSSSKTKRSRVKKKRERERETPKDVKEWKTENQLQPKLLFQSLKNYNILKAVTNKTKHFPHSCLRSELCWPAKPFPSPLTLLPFWLFYLLLCFRSESSPLLWAFLWGGGGGKNNNSFRRIENYQLAKESIPEWVLLQLMHITQSSIHVSHQTRVTHTCPTLQQIPEMISTGLKKPTG